MAFNQIFFIYFFFIVTGLYIITRLYLVLLTYHLRYQVTYHISYIGYFNLFHYPESFQLFSLPVRIALPLRYVSVFRWSLTISFFFFLFTQFFVYTVCVYIWQNWSCWKKSASPQYLGINNWYFIIMVLLLLSIKNSIRVLHRINWVL